MATAVLCAVPLLRMVPVVRGSSRMQYNDYWPMLDPTLRADGGLRWQGLLEARNQHPVVIPKLIYWANIVVSDGNNRTLGAYVLAAVAATIVGIGLLARGTEGLGRLRRCSLTVTASFLLLVPNGAWSFVKAMSGTAWLTANLLAVAALLAAQRRRRLLAPALALLATVTYGTGLAVWPALVVLAVLRDGPSARLLRHEWPTIVAGAAAIGRYAWWYASASIPGPPRPGTLELVERVARSLASLPVDGDAPLLGLAALIAGVVAVGWCWRRGVLPAAAPWVGLMVFGIMSLTLVSLSRREVVAGRYISLAALALVGLCGTTLVALPSSWRWVWALPAPLVVAASLGTSTAAPTLASSTTRHDVLAIGMHLGVVDGTQVHGGRTPLPHITDRLRELGHYPFDREAPMACGRLGEVVDVDDVPLDEEEAFVIEQGGLSLITTYIEARGLLPPDQEVDCVVALDRSDRVVGAGPVRERPEHDALGFDVISQPVPDLRIAVRFAGRSDFAIVPDRS